MNSLSFMGFIGSWCCSWATKSLRNWSLPSEPLAAFFGMSSTLMISVVLLMLVIWARMGSGSGEHVNQQPTGQLDDGLGGRSGLGVAVGVAGGTAGGGQAVVARIAPLAAGALALLLVGRGG